VALKLPAVPSISRIRQLLANTGRPAGPQQHVVELHAAAVAASLAYYEDRTNTGKREAFAQALKDLDAALAELPES
jgi:hypothetical protein